MWHNPNNYGKWCEVTRHQKGGMFDWNLSFSVSQQSFSEAYSISLWDWGSVCRQTEKKTSRFSAFPSEILLYWTQVSQEPCYNPRITQVEHASGIAGTSTSQFTELKSQIQLISFASSLVLLVIKKEKEQLVLYRTHTHMHTHERAHTQSFTNIKNGNLHQHAAKN